MARTRRNPPCRTESGEDGEAPDLRVEWLEAVRSRLRAWADASRRDLPWRAERDPYRVLVSEMMLVQTTVAAVIPYYDRFLRRFPTAGALAAADEAEVLKAWEGLGYYRRARQLQAAARAIVEEHGGRFPEDPEAVRALPGVGPYIAGAVLSFAFDRPEPIVEANTQRVLARLIGWEGDVRAGDSQRRLWRAAARLVPPTAPGAFNQALMDLGATICAPRTPRCLACPLVNECRARGLGRQDEIPVAAPRPAPLAVEEACALVARSGRLLVVRRGPGRLWEGFWEFPTIHVSGADPAGRSFGRPVDLAEGVRLLTGARVEVGAEVGTIRFGVTKHRVALTARAAVGLDEALRPGPGLVEAAWVPPGALGDRPFGIAGRRLAPLAAAHAAGPA